MYRDMIEFQDSDFEAIRILADFLPEHIFDAHAHLYDTDFRPGVRTTDGRRVVYDLEAYRKTYGTMLSNPKTLRMNMITFPDKSMSKLSNGHLKKSDEFLVKELDKDSANVGEILVLPSESEEEIENRLIHPRIRGLKCYHFFGGKVDTSQCDIKEYLSEATWQVASKRKMCITLHLVKDLSLADKSNFEYICNMAKKYPDVILILAHAARSFASWTGVEMVGKLAHLENVRFDFSAVCESPAMFQILKKAGVGRCMWGSDYPISQARGKAISLADGFYWIYQRDLNRFAEQMPVSSWLIGLENLMAVRQACIMAELSQNEIEDLFYNNAARLWNLSR